MSKKEPFKYSYDQYWNVQYTEVYSNKTERDYKIIVKAMSSVLAKKILLKKVKEDNPQHKVKAFTCNLLKVNSTINNLKLTILDWEHIHKCAFPNSANILFKFLKVRPKGYTNRFGPQTSPKNFHFKDHHSKFESYSPPEERKPYMIYDGKWRPWPKKERDALRDKIKLALSFCGNNRTEAAAHVGVSPRYLRKLMKSKFVEVNWAKDFPPPVSKFHNYAGSEIKRKASLSKYYEKIKQEKDKLLMPRVLELKDKGYSNNKIATELHTSKRIVKRCLNYESN